MAAKVWRGLAWLDALFWKVVAPALALFFLVLGVVDLPSSLQAARNDGQPGTFTAQRSECGLRHGCTFHGTFVSEDGAVKLADVFIDNGVDEVGESVPAQYVEDARTNKVYEANSRALMWVGLLLVGSVLYLIGWSWLVARPWIRQRRARRRGRI